MKTSTRKAHWESIFQSQDTAKVSWHQKVPQTSLRLIDELNLKPTANIIDIGSGDSFLADRLVERGFANITLLDISETALTKIKKRLTKVETKLRFISNDVCQFSSDVSYDLWHDRAVFHFLTNETELKKYINNVSRSLKEGGYLIVSTFSNNGPDKCSGLKVRQYSSKQLYSLFSSNFNKIKCFNENHLTPSGGTQNFTYCVFQRR